MGLLTDVLIATCEGEIIEKVKMFCLAMGHHCQQTLFGT